MIMEEGMLLRAIYKTTGRRDIYIYVFCNFTLCNKRVGGSCFYLDSIATS